MPAKKKPNAYLKKINAEVEKKIAFLKEKKVLEATREKIAANMRLELKKFFDSKKDNEALIQATDSSFTESILAHYDQSSKPENSPDKLKLKVILDDLFNMQYNSNEHLKIEKTNNNETRFLTKATEPLKIDAKDKSSAPNSEVLGVMHQKNHVTLYAEQLNKASNESKASFYEAIFLRATHVDDFTSNSKGKLELTKGTLSLLSLPKDPELKKEVIGYLAQFKKGHPNITLTYDELAAADKTELTKVLPTAAEPTSKIDSGKLPASSNGTVAHDTGASDAAIAHSVSDNVTLAPVSPAVPETTTNLDKLKGRLSAFLTEKNCEKDYTDDAPVSTESFAPAGLWENTSVHSPNAANTTASNSPAIPPSGSSLTFRNFIGEKVEGNKHPLALTPND